MSDIINLYIPKKKTIPLDFLYFLAFHIAIYHGVENIYCFRLQHFAFFLPSCSLCFHFPSSLCKSKANLTFLSNKNLNYSKLEIVLEIYS